MDKKIFFCSGMPRSGSTLLCNILAANPNIHATATSGILGLIIEVRNYWHKVDTFAAMDEMETERKKINVMRSMLSGYFDDIEKPVIIEKSRMWPAHLELATRLLKAPPKVIVTVRDVRDVLVSFEKLFRATKDTRQVSQEFGNPVEFQTMAGRMEVLSRPNQIVGSCKQTIEDAVQRGWRKQMHFVEYEQLTSNPKSAMKGIYDFLGLPEFKHDFDNVKQVTSENDLVHVWKDLHLIRPKVEPQEPSWPKMMPKQMADFYAPEAHFWRKL